MEVLKYPHPHLFKPCQEVTVFDAALAELLGDMWNIMKAERGVGLAANQVGLSQRMFVMEGPENEKLFIINPKILEVSKYNFDFAEGCLSAPGQFLKLFRPGWVSISYQNEKGEVLKRTFTSLHSVCVQHEMEHLEGKSYLQNKAIPKKARIFLAKKWGLKVK
ncbi:MAG: peptide deformylase [Candidatus Methanoperedens sp.]|nr:peptide deformylase [Candidatus Methanoperedens sp.]